LGGDAKKNQVAFGSVGVRRVPPPNPRDKLKGSFQKPNPQVPAMDLAQALARKFNLIGGVHLKELRGKSV